MPVGNQSAIPAIQTAQRVDKQPAAQRARPASVAGPRAVPRKAAVLIGCRYKNHKFCTELRQAHKDVLELQKLLVNKYRFDKTKVTLLLDDGRHLAPTRANIVSEMKKLVEGARAGDSFFFHYSGHGDQSPCQIPGEEPDNMDEAIVPCDATDDKKTWIIDNELKELLVRKIPVNAQLIAFFDMCHSGTALDLKHYCYNEKGTIHHYKRTSHDTIEDESGAIRESSPCKRSANGQDNSAPNASPSKDTRQFTCTKRKSTLRYELSNGSDSSTRMTSHVENGTTKPKTRPAKHGCDSGVECGAVHEKLALQKEAKFTSNPPLLHEEKQRKQLGGSGPTTRARRYTYPCSRRQVYRYFRSLRRDFIRRSFKRQTTLSGHEANDEKGDDTESNLPMSALALTSLLLLNPSINNSTSIRASEPAPPASTPAMLHSPRPVRASQSASGHSATVSAFVAVRKDAPVPRIASEHIVEIPRCMSPVSVPEIPSNDTASEALDSTSGTADTVIAAAATMTPNMSKRLRTRTTGKPGLIERKCRCRTASRDQECGQTISLASSSDDQITWETSKGSLTSALVSILEKDPHPTYESLLVSVQFYLNKMSDDMRQRYTHGEKHEVFANRKAKVYNKDILCQNQGKSMNNTYANLLEAVGPTLEQAKGGPVQTAIIGSQKYLDLATTRFEP